MVTFKLEVFEGPMDLLLHLISKNKLNIYDIPIAQITKQYIDYLSTAQTNNIELTADFVQMAAHLVYIKSRTLLPKTDETEIEEDDPRQELIDRLVEYQKLKNAVILLRENENSDGLVFYKDCENIKVPKPKYNELSIDISELVLAFNDVLERLEYTKPIKKESFKKIIKRQTVDIKSRIKYLYQIFSDKVHMTFSEVFKYIETKEEAVATFLAFLELMSKGNMKIKTRGNEIICKLSGDYDE